MEGYREDARPAAEAVETLLADPTPEKAAALLEKLPSLLPEDPAMAAVLAEAMAEEYGVMSSEFEEPPTPSSNSLTQQEAEKIWDDIMGDNE